MHFTNGWAKSNIKIILSAENYKKRRKKIIATSCFIEYNPFEWIISTNLKLHQTYLSYIDWCIGAIIRKWWRILVIAIADDDDDRTQVDKHIKLEMNMLL